MMLRHHRGDIIATAAQRLEPSRVAVERMALEVLDRRLRGSGRLARLKARAAPRAQAVTAPLDEPVLVVRRQPLVARLRPARHAPTPRRPRARAEQWTARVSNAEAYARAGGRRRYNLQRRVEMGVRRYKLAQLANAGRVDLIGWGAVTAVARVLGVSTSTASRDIKAVLSGRLVGPPRERHERRHPYRHAPPWGDDGAEAPEPRPRARRARRGRSRRLLAF
jgi:hypothetical protein